MMSLLNFCFMLHLLIASLLIGLMTVMILKRTLPFTLENVLGMLFTAFCWPVVLAMTIVELFKTKD